MVQVVNDTPTKYTRCPECKSVLEFRFRDILTSFETRITGYRETVCRVRCPVCSTQSIVDRV